MSYFKRKNFHEVQAAGNTSGLAKNLGAVDLILLGLGAIVGTGVFVLTGMIAARYSGPAVSVSYAIAGITCIFVALVYTELATLLPTSGSIYTYSYVAFGEIFAWLIGSVLIIELGFSSSVVAAGWGAYISGILSSMGYELPMMLTKVPSDGGFINLPAFLIVSLIGYVLYLGTKDSKKINNILVFVKMGAIFLFIIMAAPHFDKQNYEVFMPFGFDDVIIGSSILFFAFTGFGSLASTAEECKNPSRDLTFGIIGSLVLSTLVYIAVGALATGIISYTELDNAQPLAVALQANGYNFGSVLVAAGAIAGMTSVIMVNLYAQSRIFYAIARDGLLPKIMTKIHPKYDTPYVTLIIFVALAAILAGFAPYEILGQLAAMSALIDYMAVAAIVLIFRFTFKNTPRPFKCPAVFIVAPLALIASTYLLFKQIIGKNGELLLTGQILIVWFAAMSVLYLIRKRFI